MHTNKHISIKSLLFIFVLFISAASCSNDFLKQEQTVADPVQDTIRMTSLETAKAVNFNLAKAGNAHWRVFQLPVWAKITPMEGNFNDGKSTFQIEITDKTAIQQWGILNLPLAFDVDGIGYVQYPFQLLNFGNPSCVLSNYEFSINYESLASLAIHNNGGGILLWEIKDKPSWISTSKQNGYINANSGDGINLFVSRNNLSKGDHSGEITIATNSAQKDFKVKVSIKVSDPIISGASELISGDVVDADYCKSTGQLVIATKNPAQLYSFVNGQAAKVVSLPLTPVNVAISEKGDQVGLSFSNTQIAVVDPQTLAILKNLPIGIVTSDLVLGGNNWAYVSPKVYDTNYLLSIDLNSGQVVKLSEDMTGLSVLKKVPGKDVIYGSKPGWTPDFLLVFDISKGAINEQIDRWNLWLNKFWLAEDGKQIFTGNFSFFESPYYQGKGNIFDALKLLGKMESVPGIIGTVEHSLARREFFLSYRNYSNEAVTKVLRIDDLNYSVKNTYAIDNMVVQDAGYYFSSIPEIPYMFIDKSGKELIIIKVADNFHGKKDWYYEKITL